MRLCDSIFANKTMSGDKWQLPVEAIRAAIERHHERVQAKRQKTEEDYAAAWVKFSEALVAALNRNTFPQTISCRGMSTEQANLARKQMEDAGLEVKDEIDDDGPLLYHIGFIIRAPDKK